MKSSNTLQTHATTIPDFSLVLVGKEAIKLQSARMEGDASTKTFTHTTSASVNLGGLDLIAVHGLDKVKFNICIITDMQT